RWIQTALCDRPHRARRGKEIGEMHGATRAEARPVLQTHPRLGNDAEDAFGADEQAIGAWPGSGAWQPAGLDDAIRGRHPQAFNEFVDMGIEAREMATGAGRDPTSEGGIGEALREMPERQPVRPQLFFDRRAEHASLDARGA